MLSTLLSVTQQDIVRLNVSNGVQVHPIFTQFKKNDVVFLYDKEKENITHFGFTTQIIQGSPKQLFKRTLTKNGFTNEKTFLDKYGKLSQVAAVKLQICQTKIPISLNDLAKNDVDFGFGNVFEFKDDFFYNNIVKSDSVAPDNFCYVYFAEALNPYLVKEYYSTRKNKDLEKDFISQRLFSQRNIRLCLFGKAKNVSNINELLKYHWQYKNNPLLDLVSYVAFPNQKIANSFLRNLRKEYVNYAVQANRWYELPLIKCGEVLELFDSAHTLHKIDILDEKY